MEVVTALRHHPQHLGVLILTKTDRTRGLLSARHVSGVGKLGVGVNNDLVEPNDGVFVEVAAAVVVVVIVLGDENDSGQNHAFGIRVRVSGERRRGVVVVVVARRGGAAAADVGGEEENGEEDEEAEGDGDWVAEAQIGEVVGWRRICRSCGGGGGHWEREKG